MKKRTRKVIVGAAAAIAAGTLGLAPAWACHALEDGVTCTITDPNLAGTTVGLVRGDASTTITLEPGAAAIPTVDCGHI